MYWARSRLIPVSVALTAAERPTSQCRGQSQLERAAAGRWDRWLFGADAEVGALPAGIAAELALPAAIIYLPPLHLGHVQP